MADGTEGESGELSQLPGGRDLLLGPISADAEPKSPDGVRDVFDQLLSQIIEGHAAMTQVIMHAPRNADLATPDQSLEPSSDIHAITEDVRLL